MSEVCSLRTGDYQRQIAAEDTAEIKDQAKRFAKHSPVLVPLNTVLFFGGMLGGHPTVVTPDEYENWVHDWKDQYGAR